MHHVISQNRRYELLLDALPPQATSEVRDTLLAPCGNNPYNVLKQALITRLVTPEQWHMQQLLRHRELGNRKPLQFVRELQHHLDDKAATPDTAVLEEHSPQRFPSSIHVGLVSVD